MALGAKPRAIKPRERLYISPALVSQLTCLAVLGIDPRRYLEALAADASFPRKRLGKLVQTDPRDWQRALAPIVPGTASHAEDGPHDDDDQPATADAVLAAVGMQRRATAK